MNFCLCLLLYPFPFANVSFFAFTQNNPPYYNAGSYMCNKMHYTSAKCTSNMVYDLFDGEAVRRETPYSC